ncbi:MAG: YfgM family protein [Gammaproteobacteria bacterium]
MDEFLSDKEQAERLKKWWLDNYKSILAGIIIAIVIIFGWRYWQHRVQTRSVTASTLYRQMTALLAASSGPQALQIANQIINNYGDTPYASQSALAMAQYDAATGKHDAAMQMLDWVISNSKDNGLRLLARLRLARVKLAVDDPQAALTALAGVKPGGFAALYNVVRGDAYMQLGKLNQARNAYRQALNQWTPGMGDKSLVQMKLDDLNQAPAAAATQAPAARTTAGASKQ